MKRFFFVLALFAALLLPQGLYAKTGVDFLDTVPGLEITAGKVTQDNHLLGDDAVILDDCVVKTTDAKITAKRLKLTVKKDRITGIEAENLAANDVVNIRLFNYQGMTGDVPAVFMALARLSQGDAKEVAQTFKDFSVKTGILEGFQANDDGIILRVGKSEAHDISLTKTGATKVENVSVSFGGAPLFKAKSLGYELMEFPNAANFGLLENIATLPDESVAKLLQGRVKGFAMEGVTIPIASCEVAKATFDYTGENGTGDGVLSVSGINVAGDALAMIGNIPDIENGRLEMAASVDMGKREVSEKVSLVAPMLLEASADGEIDQEKNDVRLKFFNIRLKDLGIVQALNPGVKSAVGMAVSGMLPGVAQTFTQFLEKPGQTFRAEIVSEGKGIKASMSEVE